MTSSSQTLPPHFEKSTHLSQRTKKILKKRSSITKNNHPKTLSQEAFTLLSTVIIDILPQSYLIKEDIPLAHMIDDALSGPRDGWRFALLPQDKEAWEAGLHTLNHYAKALYKKTYPELAEKERGIILDDAFDGILKPLKAPPRPYLTPQQMQLWSGDLRAEIVSLFLSHPQAQEALGISANLNGGDEDFQGFQKIGDTQKEDFEPDNQTGIKLSGIKL